MYLGKAVEKPRELGTIVLPGIGALDTYRVKYKWGAIYFQEMKFMRAATSRLS
jgi:hypothetical protein